MRMMQGSRRWVGRIMWAGCHQARPRLRQLLASLQQPRSPRQPSGQRQQARLHRLTCNRPRTHQLPVNLLSQWLETNQTPP